MEKLLSIDPSGSLKQPHRLRRLLNDPLKSERKPFFYVELSFISGSIFNSVRFMLLAIAPACENLMTDNNSGGNFQGREKFSTNVRCL